MRIAMYDDEPIILNELQRFCTACFESAGISPTWMISSDPNQFLSDLEAFSPELILLDIDMPRLSGFDIASELLRRNIHALLIFVTNQESLVYETFQYKPFDFVRKGRYHEDLKRVLLRATQELSKETDLFTFRSGNVSVRLSFSEITHIESEGNYVKIYTCDNSYSYRSTMKEMQERFETQGFVRIHKGFLVNCKAVHLLHTDNVTLENGIQLPIGRAWADNAKQQIMRSFR